MPDADLIDLPQQQPPKRKILTPKILILILLSTYFVGQNIYMHIMYPPPITQNKVVIDKQANSRLMWQRLSGYAIVAGVFFVLFYFLRQANDAHDIKLYEEMKTKQEAELENERQLQRQRQQKLFKKLEEEEMMEDKKILEKEKEKERERDGERVSQKIQ